MAEAKSGGTNKKRPLGSLAQQMVQRFRRGERRRDDGSVKDGPMSGLSIVWMRVHLVHLIHIHVGWVRVSIGGVTAFWIIVLHITRIGHYGRIHHLFFLRIMPWREVLLLLRVMLCWGLSRLKRYSCRVQPSALPVRDRILGRSR
jgi:hypothetical protein